MQPLINAATPQVNSVYNPAISQIQGQVPATQQLYGALLNGLQQQQTSQVQNLNQSAAQRGVSSVGLSQGIQAGLANTLAQQSAQLGVQQASDVGGLQGQAGKAEVSKAQSIYDLSNQLHQQQLEKQSNQIEMNKQNQQAALANQSAQQNYNVRAARYANSQANKTNNFDLASVSESTLTRELRVGLRGVKGNDNHVSPENLAKAYSTWQAAGLTPDAFWKNFQGLWNPKQGNYGDQFHYFISKQGG